MNTDRIVPLTTGDERIVPLTAGSHLDPLPYVDKEDGPGKYIRQAWPDAWTEFDPRPEYEQDESKYL